MDKFELEQEAVHALDVIGAPTTPEATATYISEQELPTPVLPTQPTEEVKISDIPYLRDAPWLLGGKTTAA